MGEAKETVGTKKKSSPVKAVKDVGDTSIMDLLGDAIDKLDDAVGVKQKDLTTEGDALAAENHFKLGMLKGADSLIRRARAMLEDYGSDLDADLDPTFDDDACNGSDLEQ